MIEAKSPSPCISLDLLQEITSWKRDGASSSVDVIDRLRLRCVPSGYYTPKPWSQGA